MTEDQVDLMEQQLKMPWRDLASAPVDGARVRVHRIGRTRPSPTWVHADVGHYVISEGYKGWFNDAGEYFSPPPDSWLPLEAAIYAGKDAFETYIRDLRRPEIGEDADAWTEADFVSDLAEDGWPDHRKWLEIWCRLHDGGELTPREREQALAYWVADEDLPAADQRL